jgi:hypothetical protein
MAQLTVIQADCVEYLKTLDDNTFDSVVTDPPYALDFMGKSWDSFGGGKGFQAWCESWAAECLRVLKPGGYLLSFGGTRTYHRLACAIEDAGFEIRDSLHWIYGSGFPKSRNISKAIDSEAGAERKVIGTAVYGDGHIQNSSESIGYHGSDPDSDKRLITAPATEEAKQWDGWGTALKPAHEPIVMARKPLTGKTVASNVLEFGTGAINVDGCRVGTTDNLSGGTYGGVFSGTRDADGNLCKAIGSGDKGRWPPNILLTHSPHCIENSECAEGCPVAELDRQSGTSASRMQPQSERKGGRATDFRMNASGACHADGASRFFPRFKYNAKAPKSERPVVVGLPGHPTVKPVAVMRWLTKLVTPPGGYVLDLFGGTGTTAEACHLEGFDCMLIENDPDSIKRTNVRMEKYSVQSEAVWIQPSLWGLELWPHG